MAAHAARKVAVVGVGTTPFSSMYARPETPRSDYALGAAAFLSALEHSKLEVSDIDGLFTARLGSYTRMADMLGLHRLRLVNGFEAAGRMSAIAIELAAAAIRDGLAETVACVYGNNGRSAGARYGGDEYASPTARYDTTYGMTSPGAYVAMMYQRYAHEYGVPDGALAPLAINNRKNAALNPGAVMTDLLTETDYMSSRFIAEPLRLFDYCLINDGGVAIILTTVEKARSLGGPVVELAAAATASELTNFYTSEDCYYTASQSVADRVYGEAGVTRDQVGCVQIYDNFTPTILFSLEGFGFCPRGTSWQWIRDGRIELGGELPINTSGGHTSESYMQGWAIYAETVRQLMGECGTRQVPDVEVAQYICVSPITSSHILRRVE